MNTIRLNTIGEIKSFAGGGSGGGGSIINKPIGVFIYTIDGEFITSDAWDSANNDKAVGVFVNDGEHDFVIAKELANRGYSTNWGGYGKLLNSIPNISSDDDAKLDFNGISNTINIITELDGYTDAYGYKGAVAAKYCDEYIFINGVKGYLPACGELYLCFINKTEIDAALSKLGGKSMNNSLWTSTQKDSTDIWIYRSDGLLIAVRRNKDNYVRAFCKI